MSCDPRAVIDPSARLADDVIVGPYAIIGADVEIGQGSEIGAHAIIEGPTRIGQRNKIFPFVSLGTKPQDKKYQDECTILEIGDDNTIREYCTLNRGTLQGGGTTRIGNNNWIMAYVHIAHDCLIGSHTIFANAASLAGHVVVDDYATLGGFTLVRQFCRLGAYGFTAMGSVINKSIPPYVTVSGHMAKPRGINTEGLKRHGFSATQIQTIRQAYKILYKNQLRLEEATETLIVLAKESHEIQPIIDFLKQDQVGIIR